MSRDNRVPAYLTDDEDRALSSFANEHDMSKAEVLRKAAMEYIDRDRAARVEEKVDKLDEKIETLLAASETDRSHTHRASSGAATSKTVTRARKIAQRIYDNHDTVIKAVDVKRAIEDVAGGDPRTKEKYEGMLRERGLLYEHPADSAVWTPERERWCGWVESYVNATPTATFDDVTEEYEITIEEYEAVITQ